MSASTPTVSVVIVTYNKAETIEAAIRSVLDQTYRDFEVLVVDDGSTDDTAARVCAFGDGIRYLPKPNGGTGSARNLGIREARGRYVAFLDGDDLWLPNKLAVQMAAFEREPDLLAVQCSAHLVDHRLRVFETRRCHPRQDTLMEYLQFHNLPAFSSAVIVRREAFQAIGGFGTDLVILSDWDMACRLASAGTLRSVPDVLVLYRQYPNNQSRDVRIHLKPGMRSLRRFFAQPGLDPAICAQQARIWARFYAMLAGGYARNRQWTQSLRWSWKAIRTSPRVLPYIAGMPIRRGRKLFARDWLLYGAVGCLMGWAYAVSPGSVFLLGMVCLVAMGLYRWTEARDRRFVVTLFLIGFAVRALLSLGLDAGAWLAEGGPPARKLGLLRLCWLRMHVLLKRLGSQRKHVLLKRHGSQKKRVLLKRRG
jgi:glycosyltransferase involved in cell wall biosynthesis